MDYADPQQKWPLDSQQHCQAAWDALKDPANTSQYTPDQVTAMKAKIQAAAQKNGYALTGTDAATSGAPKPAAKVGGTATGAGYALEPDLDEWASSDELPSLLASVAPVAPPRAWFADPQLAGPTPLTITDDGRVFGHLAEWRKCHVGIGDTCVIAPKSRTDYAMFRLGPVVCDDGSMIKVGKVTLGTGHAHPQWGIVPSRNHYDNSGWAAAVVNVGEDKFGIWVSGGLTSTMTPERIAELRRSPLSGDWRRVNGNLELIAALAVNSPGFPVLHVDRGNEFSLVAAGVVEGMSAEDLDEDTAKANRLADILATAAEREQARRMARFAAITAPDPTMATPPPAPAPSAADASSLARQLDAFFTILANANEIAPGSDTARQVTRAICPLRRLLRQRYRRHQVQPPRFKPHRPSRNGPPWQALSMGGGQNFTLVTSMAVSATSGSWPRRRLPLSMASSASSIRRRSPRT